MRSKCLLCDMRREKLVALGGFAPFVFIVELHIPAAGLHRVLFCGWAAIIWLVSESFLESAA